MVHLTLPLVASFIAVSTAAYVPVVAHQSVDASELYKRASLVVSQSSSHSTSSIKTSAKPSSSVKTSSTSVKSTSTKPSASSSKPSASSSTKAASSSTKSISSSTKAISSSSKPSSSSAALSASAIKSTSSSSSAVLTSSSSSAAAAASTLSSSKSSSSSSSSSTSKTSSSTSSSATPSSTGGPRTINSKAKRGIPYNDVAMTGPFLSAPNVTWAYNWYSAEASSAVYKNYEFIPMLWGNSSWATSVWDANVKASLATGSKHLFSFNEPDDPDQSNIDPQSAAAAYMKYMQPYAGVAKLGSPAITNGGGTWGVNWLKSFMVGCANCTIDFTPCHWYDSATNFGYFKWQLEQVYNVTGKPVWVTEFGASGTDDQIIAFFEQALPWMDSQPWIERYSYFMATDGMLVNKTLNALTDYGAVYAHL